MKAGGRLRPSSSSDHGSATWSRPAGEKNQWTLGYKAGSCASSTVLCQHHKDSEHDKEHWRIICWTSFFLILSIFNRKRHYSSAKRSSHPEAWVMARTMVKPILWHIWIRFSLLSFAVHFREKLKGYNSPRCSQKVISQDMIIVFECWNGSQGTILHPNQSWGFKLSKEFLDVPSKDHMDQPLITLIFFEFNSFSDTGTWI
jgi:hypothetical protein